MASKNKPGCNCCASGCVIFTEDFSTDPFASRWTEVSGDWSWSSGAITASTTPALAVYNTSLSTGKSAKVDLSGFTADCVVRLIVRYQNSSNYIYAEVELASTTAIVRVKKKQSGTESLVSNGNSISFNGSGTLFICDNGLLGFAAEFHSDGDESYAAGTATGTFGSTQFGLYTDGDGALSNFVVGDNTGDCDYCSTTCNNCSTVQADHLKVVISGLGGSSCSFANCTQADGTYILPATFDELGTSCGWALVTPTTISCLGRLWLVASVDFNGTDYEISVTLKDGTSGLTICSWLENLGSTKPDCTAWEDLDVSTSGGGRCSPGTCLVTSL